MGVRCARGERGRVPIRGGRRTVELTSLGALTFFFDPPAATNSAIPLATAVSPAGSLEQAHEALSAMGVRTELELDRAGLDAERGDRVDEQVVGERPWERLVVDERGDAQRLARPDPDGEDAAGQLVGFEEHDGGPGAGASDS
jgi:hypothetical protein